MAVVPYNNQELKLLARLMRAEAESDGSLGMLMVGNVGVNRVLAKCLDFKDITLSIYSYCLSFPAPNSSSSEFGIP